MGKLDLYWRTIADKKSKENPLIVVECRVNNVTIDQTTYIAKARKKVAAAAVKVEAMILGTKTVKNTVMG